jgi:hypothetical protein
MGDLETEVLLDSNGQDLAIKHTQDVEPILEQNKLWRTQEQKSDWGRHVAEIPNVIYVKWLDEEHAKGNTDLRLFTPEFDAIVKTKLYDPDWAHLRTDMKHSTIGWMRKQAQWSWNGNE